MKTLSLAAVGLITLAVTGFAAPGGSGISVAVGTATAAGNSGGRPASVAPAAHVSSAPIGTSHAAPINAASGFRSINPTLNTARPSSGGASLTGRSPGVGASAGAPVYALPTMPTVRNAWSDPANPHVTAYPRNAQASNLHAGQNLYPGVYGYIAANRPANGRAGHDHTGHEGFRRYRRYYYNNFPYPVYYPYFYGGIGYDGAVGDYTGLTADNNIANLGAPDFSAASNGYYSYDEPAADTPKPDPSAAAPPPLPEAPAVGPQNPSATAKSSPGTTQQGPDSLVEAVQDELGKRGYFAGKPDAIYSDATKEAIRRFQTDVKLPATGRINEATLHALHLD